MSGIYTLQSGMFNAVLVGPDPVGIAYTDGDPPTLPCVRMC